MTRRSRAGLEGAKSRRRKTKTQKRRGGLKRTRLRKSSAADRETQSDVAQLTRERDEALEREKATAEVLRVISSSPGEVEPVFRSLLANAMRICDARFGHLLLYENGRFRAAALHNAPPDYAKLWNEPVLPGSTTALGQLFVRTSCSNEGGRCRLWCFGHYEAARVHHAAWRRNRHRLSDHGAGSTAHGRLIGFLHSASAGAFAALLAAFSKGLSEAGYVEGQNLAIEFRWADGQNDRLPALAADLVRRRRRGDRVEVFFIAAHLVRKWHERDVPDVQQRRRVTEVKRT